MEQIYTIPVNEALEASVADPSCGCPFCALYRKLEENELDLILGASMMEPDVRIQTNREGFCKIHYDMMFRRKNRLGMALTLESHLHDLQKEIHEGGLTAGSGKKPVKRIADLESTCYVCRRIENNFVHMIETAVMLWENDEEDGEYRKKFAAQPYFCLPHYRMVLEYAQKRLPRKKAPEFIKTCAGIVEGYLDTLSGDISWFCKKFDYRFEEEPWKNSKDAVERAMKFLRSDIHRPELK